MFRRFQKALRVPSIVVVLASALLTGGCASAKHDFPHLASPADDIGSYSHLRVASNGGLDVH